MLGYLLRRVLWVVPVVLTVAAITFVLMHQAPGGPWDRQKPIPAAARERLNAQFGLDKPLWVDFDASREAWGRGVRNPLALAGETLDSQFLNYLSNAARLDFGPSYQSRGSKSVRGIIVEKFPASLKVGVVALVTAVTIGLPLGVISALRQNSWLDYGGLVVTTFGLAIPSFVTGVLVVVFLSSWLGVSPLRRPEEWDGFGRAYLLPGVVLGLGAMAAIARLARASILEVKGRDYVRTARAKGLREARVVRWHILRNGLIPVITLLGPVAAELVTGSIVIETIFGVPGLGREFVSAIAARDYSMIMGTTLFYAVLVALANVAVDLCYGLLDPRIRLRH